MGRGSDPVHTTTTVGEKSIRALGQITFLKITKTQNLSKSISPLTKIHPVPRTVSGKGPQTDSKKTVHKITGAGGVCETRSADPLRPNITPKEKCWGACVLRVRRPDTVRRDSEGRCIPHYEHPSRERKVVGSRSTLLCIPYTLLDLYYPPNVHLVTDDVLILRICMVQR